MAQDILVTEKARDRRQLAKKVARLCGPGQSVGVYLTPR
jgi:hypothetical protein